MIPDYTILVLQLVDSDSEELMEYLDNELMDEMSETGFCEIWIADGSTVGPYNNVQLIGIKPEQWRGAYTDIVPTERKNTTTRDEAVQGTQHHHS